MKILAIRTDKPQAELYLYDDDKKLADIKWQAHRQLAETLNLKIDEMLNMLSISYRDLQAVAVFKGPGSFTGLRIGISVANALAYAQSVPIVARGGRGWLPGSIKALRAGQTDKIAVPDYGAPVHVTKPKN